MALAEDGAVVGSVSGGCIEDDLIARYSCVGRVEMPRGAPILVKYGVTADEAHRFGLPCGGTLELLLEFEPDAELLVELLAALEAGCLMERTVRLFDGVVTLAPTDTPAELAIDGKTQINTFGPEYRMLLIGAGQLTEYVATMALFCGFSVTVCDPREEFRGHWQVPGVSISTEMPDDMVRTFRPDARTCIVALTHDPKLDDLALLVALDTPAFYVGAIGSRRNAQARRQRMMEHCEQTEESLAQLRGPVGIYIGSKTPPEIAVSVMAEILAVKNGVILPIAAQVGPAKIIRDAAPVSGQGGACARF
jgi:xanthine dehydrogenase accessory factor